MKKDFDLLINKFLNGRGKDKGRAPDLRYSSFDFCYNYFYSFYKENRIPELANKKNLQMSCLQLGFYLASWGMMRGSSFLLQKSVRHYKYLILAISKMDKKLWEIDINCYDENNIQILLDCKKNIVESLGKNYKPSDTLVTKIMLGVFSNIPAFDRYFKDSMKIGSFNKKALLKIGNFYQQNKVDVDTYKIYTIDFTTGDNTDIIYKKAKLIDMYGYIKGQ